MPDDQQPKGWGCKHEFVVIDTYEPEAEPIRVPPPNEAGKGGVLHTVTVKEYCIACGHARLSERALFTPDDN